MWNLDIPILPLSLSKDGTFFAVGLKDGSVKLIDTKTDKVKNHIQDIQRGYPIVSNHLNMRLGPIRNLEISEENDLLVCSTEFKEVLVSLTTLKTIDEFNCAKTGNASAKFSLLISTEHCRNIIFLPGTKQFITCRPKSISLFHISFGPIGVIASFKAESILF